MGPRLTLLSKGPPARYAVACNLMLAAVLAARSGSAQTVRRSDAASADEDRKMACATAFEETQRLRNASRYLEANREVLKCSNPDCGALLSEECGRMHSELQAATPSVVFAARDKAGNELPNVSVRIDQDPSVVPLDGKPVMIDPGNHTFSFSAAGHELHSQQVVVLTGEHFRPISVVLEQSAVRSSRSAAANDSPPATREQRTSSRPPLASYVLGGVGVVGFGAFVALRISVANDFDELSSRCKPTCSTAEVDGVRRKYLFSNIALAVGAAASVAAVTVYLVAPQRAASATSLQIAPSANAVSARFTTIF